MSKKENSGDKLTECRKKPKEFEHQNWILLWAHLLNWLNLSISFYSLVPEEGKWSICLIGDCLTNLSPQRSTPPWYEGELETFTRLPQPLDCEKNICLKLWHVQGREDFSWEFIFLSWPSSRFAAQIYVVLVVHLKSWIKSSDELVMPPDAWHSLTLFGGNFLYSRPLKSTV